MYTHCPHCDTFFRVTSSQLKTANGEVRCGRCFGTFNALSHLLDEPPGDAANAAPPTLIDTTEAEVDEQDLVTSEPTSEPSATETWHAQAEQAATETATIETDLKRDHSQQLIDELQTQTATHRDVGKRLAWGLLSIPLLLVLAAQYAYFNLERLAQTAQYRPMLENLCALANCEVPLMRAPQLVKLLERDIRAHNTRENVLVVNAVIHNEAQFTQAFPAMQLGMQDITGHTMTGRRFLPEEYLADPTVNIGAGIAANTSYKIRLELVDPGKEAVGFEFEFF